MTSGSALCATYHDPQGTLERRIAELLPKLLACCPTCTVALGDVPDSVVSLLETAGVVVVRPRGRTPGPSAVGWFRRHAVRAAIAAGDPGQVVLGDFDHLLRWVESDGEELTALVQAEPEGDFTIVGRTADAIAALPAPLRATETMINDLFGRLSTHEWDLFSGVRVIEGAFAARLVASEIEESIGNDVAWPAWAITQGARVGYRVAEGLRYETDEQFAVRRDAIAWRGAIDDDILEWVFRSRLATMHLEALVPYAARLATRRLAE